VRRVGLPRKTWVHVLLFVLTGMTTTVFGFAEVESFRENRPLDVELLVNGYARLAHGDLSVLSGLNFSLPLLLILLAHEFGHYFACQRWRVRASLPYFMPSPTLFGTLGAFIRIQSPICKRRSLFDIGVSGPLAGFVMLLPFLFIGVRLSRVTPGAGAHGPFVFEAPLLLQALEAERFPGVSHANILLHPVALAAWAGLLATAINLLPIGQLDGGHILYAVFGAKAHRRVSTALPVVLVALGYWYWPWYVLAAVIFLFGRRHPLVYDETRLDGYRAAVSVVALLLFLFSICIVPVYTK